MRHGQITGGTGGNEPLILLGERLDRLTQSVAVIGFCGLVIIALLTFYDGTARYLGLSRLSGFTDYSELVYPLVIASCFPAVLLRRTNITIRLLGKATNARLNAWLEAFAALVTLGFFSIIAWQFIDMTFGFAQAGRTTATIEIPIATWWWIATAIMVLCVPVQLYVFAAWLGAAISGKTPALKNADQEPEKMAGRLPPDE